MSSYRPASPATSPYTPYRPVGEAPITSDYIVQDRPAPSDSKSGDTKGPNMFVHELEPLSANGGISVEDRPPEYSKEPEDSPYKLLSKKERNRVIFRALRFVLTTILVTVLLAIPCFVLAGYADVDTQDKTARKNNLIYWIFLWLVLVWVTTCLFRFFGLVLPYVFYIVAKFVNPAHRKYWRVLRALRFPITLLGAVLGLITLFAGLIDYNPYFAMNGVDFTDDTLDNGTVVTNATQVEGYDTYATMNWVFYDVMYNVIAWVVMYWLVKCLIMYITIHYHYRSDSGRIEKSKNLNAALGKLYETSVYLDPLYSKRFQTEDLIIRNASSSGKRSEAAKFFQRIGGVSAQAMSMFGTAMGSDNKSHWLKSASTYATVERAMSDTKSAAALAQRIWISLASDGKDVLTVDDIAEAMGPHKTEEAKKMFELLDENENGDIRLDEMVQTVVESSRTRNNIYQGMSDMDHAINTFEWVLLIMVAMIMIFIILVKYFPPLKDIQSMVGFGAAGLGFALGRTVNDFLSGAIFIFFKHAYDNGDRIDLFNMGENQICSVVVKRVTLLYCTFERTDDGKIVQFPNSRLSMKRIENLTRSGLNREKASLFVDINTSFKDIEYLRGKLKSFLSQRDNARDYKPDLALRVKSVHELNKLELAVVFTHKSNWSNEALRSARSSKFYCALVDALRSVPIVRPQTLPPKLGSDQRPNYQVMISEERAAELAAADKQNNQKARYDFEQPEPTSEKKDDGAEDGGANIYSEELARMRKAEKERKAREDERKAREAIGAIPPALAGPNRERVPVTINGGQQGVVTTATSLDASSFRRLMSDAGAEGFVHQHGLGGRRRGNTGRSNADQGLYPGYGR